MLVRMHIEILVDHSPVLFSNESFEKKPVMPSRILFCIPTRGGKQTKDCSPTWSFGFQFRLGKHERGLAFYYLKIRFLEYLHIYDEMRYPNAPISDWKKATIWKEPCIVHVGAVIYDYQGEEASWSTKCLWWKDCPGDLTSLNTDNVNFCTWSRLYQREASRPSGPGRVFFSSF